MPRVKCIIVDDELSAIQTLTRHVIQIEDLEILATFTNPLEALSYIRENEVDLAFLDINMDALSGLDLAASISCKVIFTTGHGQFALTSYKYENVIGYLLKPVIFDDLLKAVRKAITLHSAEKLFYGINNDYYLVYRTDGATIKINYDSIVYIKSKNNYSIIQQEVKETTAPIPLWEIEKSLPKSKFKRVNKSSIVNMKKIVANEHKAVVLLGGHKLSLSKAYSENITAE